MFGMLNNHYHKICVLYHSSYQRGHYWQTSHYFCKVFRSSGQLPHPVVGNTEAIRWSVTYDIPIGSHLNMMSLKQKICHPALAWLTFYHITVEFEVTP